jgi:8-oxo-dGTP diphosphatase
MKTVDTVSLIILQDDKILVERRALHKATDPGIVVIPGGHVEPGETLEEACKRELKEELDLDCFEFKYLDKMLWNTPLEIQNVHYFVCEGWSGSLKSQEADEVFFIKQSDLSPIDIEEERKILEKHLKK